VFGAAASGPVPAVISSCPCRSSSRWGPPGPCASISSSDRIWWRPRSLRRWMSLLLPSLFKGTYTLVRSRWHMNGNYRDTVANVDASDSRCRCIGRIIARDLRLVASRPFRMAITRPGSRAAVTLCPSSGANLLGCINRTREQE